jgi:hypothetical protein
MKKTDWFPGDVAPVYRGYYQRKYNMFDDPQTFDYWTGKFWCYGNSKPYGAHKCLNQRRLWRGLTEKAA